MHTLKAVKVETWLQISSFGKSELCQDSNLMIMLLNHGVRHGICDANPIRLVRQSCDLIRVSKPLASSRG